jgi:hypothetical protein
VCMHVYGFVWSELYIYTIYDRIFGDFPAKNTVDAPCIYGYGQPFIFVYVRGCMYVCMHACMYARVCVCVRLRMHARMHVCAVRSIWPSVKRLEPLICHFPLSCLMNYKRHSTKN